MGGTGIQQMRAEQEAILADPAGYITRREQSWTNRPGPDGDRERLLKAQKEQGDLEKAQKKNAEELSMALKFQKQFAASAQGKNGTLLTNPSSNGVEISPPPGQKTLLGQ